MQRITHWLDELVACDDGEISDELFDRIVALGESARSKLVELATDPAWRGNAADGGGLAPYHAMQVIEALAPGAATAARLVESIESDPNAVEVDDLVRCLAAAGDVAVPALVAALTATTSAAAAGAFAEALVGGDAVSENVFASLVAACARFPGEIARPLGDYGDPRALDVLHAGLGAHFIGAGCSEDDEEDAFSLAQAIEDLGGELTQDERRKIDLARRRQARRAARAPELPPELDAAAARPPHPNDPCPCGSGRKFKKCHEGDAEFGGASA